MSSEVSSVAGSGIPLVGNDIDTDRIIPARFLRSITFDGLGQQVFIDDRAQGQHPFDLPQYQGAQVLVVNGNFGCGSSREHAPQALARWGIQAIVGESFAEIFFGNCVAIGVPCVTADAAIIQGLQADIAAHPQLIVTVDLVALQVVWGDQQAPVRIDEGSRQMFLAGTWDACGQLLAQKAEVLAVAGRIPYLQWAS